MKTPSAAQDAARGLRFGPPLPLPTLIGFALALLAVILVAVYSARALQLRSSTSARVTQTFLVRQQITSLMSLLKDAETGQRGFLLVRAEAYLEPYTKAKAALPEQLKTLRGLTVNTPAQRQRLDTLEQLVGDKMAELGSTIALQRAGNVEGALAMVRTDRGRQTMDNLRTLISQMEDEEENALANRRAEWDRAVALSAYVTWGGSALLLIFIGGAAVTASRDHRARQSQAWVRTGQMGLNTQLQGEQRLDKLGANALEFLADFLGARVGAMYLAEPDGRFRRVSSYALSPGQADEVLRPGDGLLGQAAKQNRVLLVRDVPDDYLQVRSGVGHGKPRELLIAPASVDDVVQAVLELGFFHPLRAADQDLLARASESLGVAVRSAKDRTRLEELLEETQRQAEELQTQQEELRVNNEELEEQSRALKESRSRLETQQAELEQINSQLEEQAQMLESQKDELSKSQAVLLDKTTELERSNKYKSEFLANMSHELRTPLNSSLILSKLLADNKDNNLTPEQVKFAQTIFSAGNDLLALINDILDLSKIEAGKVELMPEPVAIALTVEGLSQTFEPIAREKNLAFRTSIHPSAPERIETDAQRLNQILKNLLSNALKFTEAGEVSLDVASESDGTVSFAVRDTGIGIPAHQQEIIFGAFQQADGSTHRKYGGTGLGLSISRDLARLLGGDITVQSQVGQGSAFTLTLPREHTGSPIQPRVPDSQAKPLAQPGPRAAPPRPAPPPANAATALSPITIADDRDALEPDKRLILVVEDDVSFATILRDLVHEMGFKCVVTHSASDALTAASLYRPSAILLDINLPDYSGLGVLDRLKHDPDLRHIPVHVASVADYAKQALERGAIGYTLKPVKREQLVEALERLEAKFSQRLRHVLVVEDDERQRESIRLLLANDGVQITGVETATEALAALQATTFDCMVMDLSLPDLSGYELLEKMAEHDDVPFPPVIVYTGRSLTLEEDQRLRRFSKSIIVKDARSPERLLDEVTLFLHQVESTLPPEHQRMLKAARQRDDALEGKRILVVEDDVRNIFALSHILEPKGAKIEIARNGKEAIDVLTRTAGKNGSAIDLVLMDIMMPEMDGLTAMREIRKRPEWKKLPIIALTAKAMRDDQEKCLAAGANDYIAKPLDVEKLLSLVRVWMPG